ELVDGKAKLVGEIYCDGLGACIGDCPVDALTVTQEDVPEYEGHAPEKNEAPKAGGCPGTAAKSFGGCPSAASKSFQADTATNSGSKEPSALTHWPIQLKLINPAMPVYQGADVLLAADCTAFALGSFHPELLQGRGLIIACPKLDDHAGYVEKLTTLLTEAKPTSVTIARMEVPCCTGLVHLLEQALSNAGDIDTTITEVIVGVQGDLQGERKIN
ncbi:MAG: ATP-binding protein, partial [Planctomycetota bacterium]